MDAKQPINQSISIDHLAHSFLLNEKKVNTVIGQQYQQNKQSTSHLNH